ncbi:MAG: carbohydrate ABC transporter permease [Firmicutes bacterium]|nr:carbohydrate ABC transporter permease [Bacillota bacterium]
MTSKQRISRSVVIYAILCIASVLSIAPILWTVLTSFKPPIKAFTIPPAFIFRPTLESYKMLFFQGHIALGVDIFHNGRNSIIIALCSTAITIIVAVLGSYALSRFRFKGKRLIAFIIIAVRMLPPIGTIVPMFLLMNKLRLLDTQLSLILAYTALNIPFTTWMLRGFIDELPFELEEAAMIDGCSRVQSLIRVIFPLLGPGLVATSFFSFLLSWNDFALALTLTNRQAITLPMLVMSFITEEGVNWGPMSAAITLIIIPPILFVALCNRWIAKGLTMGAVKG